MSFLESFGGLALALLGASLAVGLSCVGSAKEMCIRDRLNTSQTFYLEGWVPEENWPQLEKALEKYPCAYEAADPVREEYPDVPVKLKKLSLIHI